MEDRNRAEIIDWKGLKHFDPEEFDDPDHPGSWKYMDPLTILWLNEIRKKTGWPIITHNKFEIHGCVCIESKGHSDGSRHYVENECDAVDWHFDCDVDWRIQAMIVIKSKFTGIGIYYDWKWARKPLKIGYHTDRRREPQIWKRENGKYVYLLK